MPRWKYSGAIRILYDSTVAKHCIQACTKYLTPSCTADIGLLVNVTVNVTVHVNINVAVTVIFVIEIVITDLYSASSRKTRQRALPTLA